MPRRRLTPEDKQRRKDERKAAALTAKSLKLVGGPNSLFRDMAHVFTRDEAYWHTRRTAAAMIEHLHQGPASRLTRAFDWVLLRAVQRFARTILPGTEVDEIVRRIGDNPADRQLGKWIQILTKGERIGRLHVEERPEWVNKYNREGRRVFEVDHLPSGEWHAVMTYDEFRAKFPPLWTDGGEEPEPPEQAALFDRVMARIRGET